MIIQPEYNRGVVVNSKGHFIAAIVWAKDEPIPNWQTADKVTAQEKIILLRDEAALAVPSNKARWDFTAKTWTQPGTQLWIINEATGQMIGQGMFWRDSLPPLAPGSAYVDTPPPTMRSRRTVYDKETDTWVQLRRVGMVNTDGVLYDILLENPLTTTADISVPAGHTRVEAADTGWPVAEDTGQPIGIGAILQADSTWLSAEGQE